jgi:hypothetical protein
MQSDEGEDHDRAGVGFGGAGHNRPPRAAQWQVPHRDGGGAPDAVPIEQDIDKVETAFVQGFMDAPDPTSFLRLAHVPFEFDAPDGARLTLLRVEIEAMTDVGSVTPHLGGTSFRYDPLPANLVSRRRRLRFVYFDGGTLRRLSFAELRRGQA